MKNLLVFKLMSGCLGNVEFSDPEKGFFLVFSDPNISRLQKKKTSSDKSFLLIDSQKNTSFLFFPRPFLCSK